MTTSSDAKPPLIRILEPTDQIVALDLEGEFDISAVPDVSEHAKQAIDAGKHLIINLSEVTFIDSSMIHALFTADAAAAKSGRRFVLQFGTHASVERVLEITGTDKALPTAPTREAAIGLIRQAV